MQIRFQSQNGLQRKIRNENGSEHEITNQSRVCSGFARSAVAQVGNLLCRRLATGEGVSLFAR
jgi:hypothetical protein